MKHSRVPKQHIEAIISLARELGQQPRYSLAAALKKTLDSISMKTALDYINAAADEGLLRRVGDRIGPHEQ